MFGTAYEPSSSFATYEDKISFEQIVVSSTTVCLVSVGVCNIADEKQHRYDNNCTEAPYSLCEIRLFHKVVPVKMLVGKFNVTNSISYSDS